MSSLESQYQTNSVAAVVPGYKRSRLWIRARNSSLGQWVRSCRRCPHELLALLRSEHVSVPRVQDVTRSISALQSAMPESEAAEDEADAPIFLLSTGWRSGSTLLQRILVTDPSLLLWGEPLGEMALLSRLTEMVSHFISDRNLTEWRIQPTLNSSSLSKAWIANLYPSSRDFRSALRSVFDRWLGMPARDHGFARWGLKEVRIGASEATLLHWLYPQARFVVISRHPYDCYRSLVDSGWPQVYDRYPEVSVDSAAAFARHWNRIAVSWSQLPAQFPIVKIRYEDIVARKVDFRELESWLGITIQENSALSVSVGGTATRAALSWYERLIIAHEAAAGMLASDYKK